MESSVITNSERFKNLQKDWDTLLEKSETSNIFLTFDWLFCRWHFLENDNSLFIVTITDNGDIVGIAPFMLAKKGRFVELGFIGKGVSDYEDIIVSGDQKKREEIIVLILETIRHSKAWNVFQLKGIPQDSPNLIVFKRLQSNYKEKMMILMDSHHDGAPYIEINQDWESYCNTLRKKFVADSRRQKKRLEKDFPEVKLEHVFEPDEAEYLLSGLLELHKHIRNVKNTQSIFDSEENRLFFHRITKDMLKINKLIFSALKIDKEVAALHMGFIDKNVFYYYIPAYNQKFSQYSIGRLLLLELVKYAFEQGFSRFDFMLGEEDYKQEWTTKNQELYFINIFSQTLSGNIAFFLSIFKLKIKKLLGRKW